ncbi:squalene--hopene cyclase [Gluconobacter wancherniae]|uniref:squalene--hopene cyclase n=1 Tax=Gluconobacter wancherniae TaxID=1307955 RepID=UPI0011BE0C1A|nr:squalene--hopene cyclase [Gluconobacter wancherniae]MBF0853395.1 squalene--hopene cyclase [Gluconobacter wancherniae]GBD55872.1 squalene-hopene cyclase [Gluconobacter wancherniae NBRC 103581]
MLIYSDVLEKEARVSETLSRKPVDAGDINDAITGAHAALGGRQKDDGHWVFELEADATIPSEYVLLEHYLDRIDQEKQDRIGVYLRRTQCDHGGWPLYEGGKFDLSATVKAYFALKAIGDNIDAPHMKQAREAILDRGGAARANVFTRIQLALFGEVPWRATPVMPVELMLLPRTAFFSVWNMAYWSRAVIAPMLVLGSLKPLAVNPRGIHVQELFVRPPEEVRDWIRGPYRSVWGRVFKHLDTVLRPIVPMLPRKMHQKAIKVAIAFVEERLSLGGLGAIYPAMANVVMMYRALGVPDEDPRAATAWQGIQDLLVKKDNEIYCQPCVSPVWDTALSGLAMLEAASGPHATKRDETVAALKKSAAWLRDRQILDVKGDWAINAPDLRPGGWAFQYENDYYPDVDDTAVVGMLLHRLDPEENREAIERAREWIIGMQSTNGGWGAFDINNDLELLNHIPFSDHGALLDPPTADVSARCVSFLCQLGHAEDRPVIDKALEYLRAEQEREGCWFGRWGTNYIYGTWSVLCALNIAGVSHDDAMIKRAVAWLEDVQRPDGGWGEDCASYEGGAPGVYKESLPTQTAWAVLALMAVGQRESDAVKRGMSYLVSQQDEKGEWHEEPYNAVGFPKVFYLRYHGYKQFFPLTALSRYRNLSASNTGRVEYGF